MGTANSQTFFSKFSVAQKTFGEDTKTFGDPPPLGDPPLLPYSNTNRVKN